MNIIIESLNFFVDQWDQILPVPVATLLLSANAAKGNDGRYCPLFHGSLAPMLFAETHIIELQELLVNSNTITWTKGVNFDPYMYRSRFEEVFAKLLKTKYFTQSVREISINSSDNKQFAPFCTTSCRSLEKISVSSAPISIREMFSHLTHSLKSLRFDVTPRISGLDALDNFTQLESLSFQFTKITDEDFQHLRLLPKLKTLTICREDKLTLQNSRNVFEQLSLSLREFRFHLEARECDVSGIGELVNLEVFTFSCSPFSTIVSGFEEWRYFLHLRSFSLSSYNWSIKFPSFKNLAPLPNLKELDVSFSSSINNVTDLIEISPNIKKINLSASIISKQIIDAVGTKLNFLEELRIGNVESGDVLPWDGPICESLRKVNVYGMTVEVLDFLTPCKTIEELQLTRSGFKDFALIPKSFRKLKISRYLTDTVQKLFDPENKFDTLEELIIESVPLNDAVLQGIAQSCPKLRKLNLSKLEVSELTKANPKAVEAMTNLEVFRVQKGCFEKSDLLELKMKWPDLKIVIVLDDRGEYIEEIKLKTTTNEIGNRRDRE